MNIKRITIQNFRNIAEETDFYLNPHFTAFIGVNGKGKSTILHALRIATGAYFLSIPEVKSRNIQRDEIRLVLEGRGLLISKYPVKVEAEGTFSDVEKPIIWRRQWLEGSSSSTTKNADVGEIKGISSEKFKRLTEQADDTVDLPIIAFFGISRAVGGGRITKNSRIHRLGRRVFIEGYQDWEEMKSVKFHYDEWLLAYDRMVEQKREYPGTKDAFFKAVQTANPFITEITFTDNELWVKVKIEDNESELLPLSLHSDGIHYFTAMVAEIAYRCIVLNGYLNQDTITKTTGIILIDEIDLHLHPTWQRHVVSDLKNAFPNIQFVVTTHSPFIVQSLKSDEIWNLDKVMDVAPDRLKIDTVATEIMGVSSPYSDANEELYNKSKRFMEDLDTGKSEAELERDLNDVSDPAVRAFLELNKISKGK